MRRPVALFALSLFPLLPGACWAQATPDGARALEQQIRDWAATTLGPNAQLSSRVVEITPEGDHYAVAVPLGAAADAPRLTATARAKAGNIWSIDDVRMPSPATFHVDIPAGTGPNATPGTGRIDYTITIGQQAGQVQFDPSFATAMTSTSTVQDIDIQAKGSAMSQSSHIDRGSSATLIQPTANGRVDVSVDSNLEGYKIDSTLPDKGGQFSLRFGTAHVKMDMNGVSRDRTGQLIRSLVDLTATMRPGSTGKTPPLSKEASAALLALLADLATGVSLDETLQDIKVDVGGVNGSLRAAQLGFAAKSANGLLEGRMELGAEGLTLPDLGLGPAAQLIPTKLNLRPTVSGVPTAALMRMIEQSGDKASPGPEAIMALFGRGPITAGLDSLTLNMGGAEFGASGKVQIASPQAISGTGQVTANNLDALQQRIAAEPSLAQAGPAIIFIKGIGRSVGSQMVWDITYQSGHLLVNNQDMTAMLGGAGSQPPPAATPPARPRSPGQPGELRRRQ